MYCPNCGTNQSNDRRFCTSCGTNLTIVSQALNRNIPQSVYDGPPILNQFELQRQKEVANGLKYSIIGGGIIALKFFSLIFSGRGGPPLGLVAFIGLIFLAVGVSKLIGHRAASGVGSSPGRQPDQHPQSSPPRPVFSAEPNARNYFVRDTGNLDRVHAPRESVTEDETQHLPIKDSPRHTRR